MTKVQISIIIVNYQKINLLKNCIESIIDKTIDVTGHEYSFNQ